MCGLAIDPILRQSSGEHVWLLLFPSIVKLDLCKLGKRSHLCTLWQVCLWHCETKSTHDTNNWYWVLVSVKYCDQLSTILWYSRKELALFSTFCNHSLQDWHVSVSYTSVMLLQLQVLLVLGQHSFEVGLFLKASCLVHSTSNAAPSNVTGMAFPFSFGA